MDQFKFLCFTKERIIFQTESEPTELTPLINACSNLEPFALQVIDESMAPEFPPQCIIVVDPNGKAVAGSFVVVRMVSELTLGRLQNQGERWFLTQSTSAKAIPLPEGLRCVYGVVSQRIVRGEKPHHY